MTARSSPLEALKREWGLTKPCYLNHPTFFLPTMSTERELVDKFNEAFGTKKMEHIYPYLADDMIYEVLPSTLVIVVVGDLPGFANALMQGGDEIKQR